MNENFDQSPPQRPDESLPPMVIPVRRPSRPAAEPPPRPPRGGAGVGTFLLALVLLASVGLNLLVCFGLLGIGMMGTDDTVRIREKPWGGNKSASNKVAIVQVDGVLMDEFNEPILKAIDKAAQDDSVKAVVVRINSPGGTVPASDAIHKRLSELRHGNSPRYTSPPKHLVASMGPIAASGGYYVAMPAEHIYAEKSTITGSIGVYVSMLNVHQLANEHGVKMELIKAGEVKAAGSAFHEMKPQERQIWQDMVDNSYKQFIQIVEDGRPHLKGKLTKDLPRVDEKGNRLPDEIAVYNNKGEVEPGKTVPYRRKLADGGIFTAPAAKQYELIDDIGYVEDAARKAATLAGIGTNDYKIVIYEKPFTLMNLFGGGAKQAGSSDFMRIAAAAGPRVWYLAPNSEFAGMLALMGK